MLPIPSRSSIRPFVRVTVVSLAMAALLAAFAGEAQASCSIPKDKAPSLKSLLGSSSMPMALAPAGKSSHDSDDIVGLWYVVFKTKDGNVWDKGFQQYHADKTEITIDNAVPPALGNVCIGVWELVGHNVKLRHVTWNWNEDGTPAGTFLLLSTVKLDKDGDEYTGTFVSDSFDLSGKAIPALHAEGTLKGVRIRVN